MRIILMIAMLLLSTPAWPVTEHISSGSFVMYEDDDFAPRVTLAGGGVFLQSDYANRSEFIPVDWSWLLASVNPGERLDISGRGRFETSADGDFVTFGIQAVPFVAQAGVNTTRFLFDGRFNDEWGPEYYFSGFGRATLSFKASPWPAPYIGADLWIDDKVSYLVSNTWEGPIEPVNMPEPGTVILLASGIGLLWMWRPRAAVREGREIR